MAELVKKEATEVAPAESTRSGIYYTPRVDIYENDDELVFLCDLPGVKPADVELRFDKGELTLHGKVPCRHAPAEFLREEYGMGDFFRSFTIPTEVDATKIAAESKLGVLTIHLPKQEQVKPKRIPIKGE